MATRTFALRATTLAILLGAACATTTGQGTGVLSPGNPSAQPVSMSWKSENGGQSGTMTVSLPGGPTYSGPFFQIRSTTETRWDSLEPLWYGWTPGWPDWPYWGPAWGIPPERVFVTRYSGKVVANLSPVGGSAPAGKRHLRCRFHLADPASGMKGGGQGECQLENGETISATFAG